METATHHTIFKISFFLSIQREAVYSSIKLLRSRFAVICVTVGLETLYDSFFEGPEAIANDRMEQR